MGLPYTIYTGRDWSNPDSMKVEAQDELYQREDMPQDYAWRALGDHIASGPSDVPQTVDALVRVRGRWIRARAVLSYVEVDENGEPLADKAKNEPECKTAESE